MTCEELRTALMDRFRAILAHKDPPTEPSDDAIREAVELLVTWRPEPAKPGTYVLAPGPYVLSGPLTRPAGQ